MFRLHSSNDFTLRVTVTYPVPQKTKQNKRLKVHLNPSSHIHTYNSSFFLTSVNRKVYVLNIHCL